MFSWASQQLENLVQTVAPPPTDAQGRYVYCVQKGDETGAQSCLAEFDPLGTVVHPTKGSCPLHLACQYNMTKIIRQLMSIPGANINVVDYSGNTALHYACLSDNKAIVETVRLLVTQFGASVVAKNSLGQTPYDLATLNGVRQYLLPLQLQQETRDALDNGGVGLPPGIDLGGMRIQNSALPPPPMGGMGMPGPPPSTPGPTHGMYGMMATPSPSLPANYPVQTVPANATTAVPPAPASGPHTYSRTGGSSAAIFSNKYKSDGFHSSSSDVNLQIKYGHSSTGNLAAAVPPPPSSGNNSSTSAPPSAGYGAANPYAAFGGGAMKARYPVYNAAPGMPQVQASTPGGYNYGIGVPPPAAANFAMFNPAAVQPGTGFHQQPAQYPVAAQPGYQQPQAAPAPYAQPEYLPAQLASTIPASPFLPPPPLSSMYQPQQPAYPQSLYQPQPPTPQQPVMANASSPYSAGVSQELFPAQPTPLAVNASPYSGGFQAQQSPASGNAQQLFSSPAAAPVSENAYKLFSAPVASSPGMKISPYNGGGFQVPKSPVSANAQQLFSTGAAPVSGNAMELSGGPGSETGNYQQPPMSVAQPIEQSMSVSSAKSADELFGGPVPDTTPLAALNNNGTPDHSKQDAASMFATPLPHVEGVVRTVTEDTAPSNVSTAKELFVPPIEKVVDTQQPAVDAASLFGSQPAAATSAADIFGAPTADSTPSEAEDEMMDIPLSPKNFPPPAMSSLQQAASNPAPISAAASLFGSIGMPPPPFSNKQ